MKTLNRLFLLMVVLSACAHRPEPPHGAGMGMELWGWVNGQSRPICLRYGNNECCGYQVRTVCEETGAGMAGIRPGQVVYEINGQEIADLSADAVARLSLGRPQTKATVRLCGSKKVFTLKRMYYTPCWL